ncbi:MAG: STAS/SEC14 domain-containing protein [Bacteroidetes bacterium]|nr:STAS/SEC14 domain-containing protein [Bacteroidota bacterium]MBU1374188.1 STAS/SEC14 domain-containing protein [Bacteroidota bacterium]MBU1485899.1 STAS/SEC14 domain-containing protein [Bacteroidota bacterium]MBU1762055.1 STAS/SEC14 domain-containing protein [Bacteroidota bacterium]MBU2046829.1 STAS/SEC14 domain-containing protein [Bacteroidota bacterium]
MNIPNKHQPLIKGEIANYYFDEEGILYSYSNGIKRTVENIGNNVDLVKKITKSKPVPLLIYLKNSPIPDKATRKFSTEKLPEIYSAMAMVSKLALSKLIMNILFKLNTPPIPMKSFTNDLDAKDWLKQFL